MNDIELTELFINWYIGTFIGWTIIMIIMTAAVIVNINKAIKIWIKEHAN